MPGGFPGAGQICNGVDCGTNTATNLGVTVGSGAADAYGSWHQIIASSPMDAVWMDVTGNGQGWLNYCGAFQIGIGPAGSEVVIATDLVCPSGSSTDYHFSFPCSIPAGTRIAARSASTGGTAGVPTLQLTIYDGDFNAGEFAGLDSIGYLGPIHAYGTAIDPGAVAYTKGVFAQLSASTPKDYAGFFFQADGQDGATSNAFVLIDIAIGASGSEQIIIPNIPLQVMLSGTVATPTIFWLPIPAGSRVAARAASSNSASPSRVFGLTLYGIYK